MGRGWRRVSEAVGDPAFKATAAAVSLTSGQHHRQQVRQNVISFAYKQDFEPTSNARNEAMFKEATDFAALIKIMEKDLHALEKQIESKWQWGVDSLTVSCGWRR